MLHDEQLRRKRARWARWAGGLIISLPVMWHCASKATVKIAPRNSVSMKFLSYDVNESQKSIVVSMLISNKTDRRVFLTLPRSDLTPGEAALLGWYVDLQNPKDGSWTGTSARPLVTRFQLQKLEPFEAGTAKMNLFGAGARWDRADGTCEEGLSIDGLSHTGRIWYALGEDARIGLLRGYLLEGGHSAEAFGFVLDLSPNEPGEEEH